MLKIIAVVALIVILVKAVKVGDVSGSLFGYLLYPILFAVVFYMIGVLIFR